MSNDFATHPSMETPASKADRMLYWLSVIDSSPEDTTAMRTSGSWTGRSYSSDMRIARSEVQAVCSDAQRGVEKTVLAARYAREEDWDLLEKLVRSTTSVNALVHMAARRGMPDGYYDAVVSRCRLVSVSPDTASSTISALGHGAPLRYIRDNAAEIVTTADTAVFAAALSHRFCMFRDEEDLSDLESLLGLISVSGLGHSPSAVGVLVSFLEASAIAGNDIDEHLAVLSECCGPDADFRVSRIVQSAVCAFAAGLYGSFWGPSGLPSIDSSPHSHEAALSDHEQRHIELTPGWVRALQRASSGLRAWGYAGPGEVRRWAVYRQQARYAASAAQNEDSSNTRRIPVRMSAGTAAVLDGLSGSSLDGMFPEHAAALCGHGAPARVQRRYLRLVDRLIDKAAAEPDESLSDRLLRCSGAALAGTIAGLYESGAVREFMGTLDRTASRLRGLLRPEGFAGTVDALAGVPWPATVDGKSVVEMYSQPALELIATMLTPSERRPMHVPGVLTAAPIGAKQDKWLGGLDRSCAGPWYVCASFARETADSKIPVGLLVDMVSAAASQPVWETDSGSLPSALRLQEEARMESFVRLAARLMAHFVGEGARLPPQVLEVLVDVLLTVDAVESGPLFGAASAGSPEAVLEITPEGLGLVAAYGRLLNRHFMGTDPANRRKYLTATLGQSDGDETLLFTERLAGILSSLGVRDPLSDEDWYGGDVDWYGSQPKPRAAAAARRRRKRAVPGQLALPV